MYLCWGRNVLNLEEVQRGQRPRRRPVGPGWSLRAARLVSDQTEAGSGWLTFWEQTSSSRTLTWCSLSEHPCKNETKTFNLAHPSISPSRRRKNVLFSSSSESEQSSVQNTLQEFHSKPATGFFPWFNRLSNYIKYDDENMKRDTINPTWVSELSWGLKYKIQLTLPKSNLHSSTNRLGRRVFKSPFLYFLLFYTPHKSNFL